MHTILFLDTVCPKAYSPDTLKHEAMGGTEATVVRIAEALSEYATTYVAQHNREITESYGAKYVPVDALPEKATHVVVIRSTLPLSLLKEKYPNAKFYVWLHDVTTVSFASVYPLLQHHKADCITVSAWHKTQTIEAFKAHGFQGGGFTVQHIYNPVIVPEYSTPAAIDKNKLVFFSSPHKGLEYTLEVFKLLRRMNKDYVLKIANPGYFPTRELNEEGVEVLGAVAHDELMNEVRTSLCVFHLNTTFPETQGIVYGEAQALGTPFIAHDMAAVWESSDHPAQVFDVRDKERVIQTVERWRQFDRPKVRLKPDFKLSTIVKKWISLFDRKKDE